MKRGVLILILLFTIILSSCTAPQSEISYPKIITNRFINEVIEENNNLKVEISELKEEVKYKQEEIDLLSSELARFYLSPEEKASPYDWIKAENIKVFEDKIVIELENAVIAQITDTHSLEPLIDKKANVIEIVPSSPTEIHLGDLVAYTSEYANGTILHRVITIGKDDKGWYSIMKGDNNPKPDPGKIRFEQILRVVVGVIY
ncbi:MAG: hypothetical protein ABH828_05755 [archaeon]